MVYVLHIACSILVRTRFIQAVHFSSKATFLPTVSQKFETCSRQKPSEIHNSHPQHPKHQPPAPCFRSKMPHFLWAVRGAHFLRCSKSHHPYVSCSVTFPHGHQLLYQPRITEGQGPKQPEFLTCLLPRLLARLPAGSDLSWHGFVKSQNPPAQSDFCSHNLHNLPSLPKIVATHKNDSSESRVHKPLRSQYHWWERCLSPFPPGARRGGRTGRRDERHVQNPSCLIHPAFAKMEACRDCKIAAPPILGISSFRVVIKSLLE